MKNSRGPRRESQGSLTEGKAKNTQNTLNMRSRKEKEVRRPAQEAQDIEPQGFQKEK